MPRPLTDRHYSECLPPRPLLYQPKEIRSAKITAHPYPNLLDPATCVCVVPLHKICRNCFVYYCGCRVVLDSFDHLASLLVQLLGNRLQYPKVHQYNARERLCENARLQNGPQSQVGKPY